MEEFEWQKKQRQLNDKYSSTKKYWGDELNGFSMSGLSGQSASKNVDDLGFTHRCRNTQYRMDFSNFQPIHCYLKGFYILTSFAKLKNTNIIVGIYLLTESIIMRINAILLEGGIQSWINQNP